jgi:hypothetical protein
MENADSEMVMLSLRPFRGNKINCSVERNVPMPKDMPLERLENFQQIASSFLLSDL